MVKSVVTSEELFEAVQVEVQWPKSVATCPYDQSRAFHYFDGVIAMRPVARWAGLDIILATRLALALSAQEHYARKVAEDGLFVEKDDGKVIKNPWEQARVQALQEAVMIAKQLKVSMSATGPYKKAQEERAMLENGARMLSTHARDDVLLA
ncbi:hypothetical protein [Ruegeria sp. HKCCA4707]|uniref:hypothetical protein n=1 Tax=Ruegeria sp. HKCCA4707 TaxID=2682984 RepID=UPI001488CF01|nr:hypothetical protein [Ruegeria sp. HKCCA4707]